MMNTMVQKTQLNSITHSFFFPCSVSKDRFVEWMMRDFRMWLGKTGNAHTGTLLERCAVMLGQLKRDKNIARTFLHADSANAREKEDAKLYVNAIFCEVFVFAMEANLFGDGPPPCTVKSEQVQDRKVLPPEPLTMKSLRQDQTSAAFVLVQIRNK